jgi:photosystem II stability/assembly factor-like uncharacterized protein
MGTRNIGFTVIAVLLCITGISPEARGQVLTGSEPYIWKNVRIVGGGFVTGFVFHPSAPGIRYCRTDMGGAYRWNGDKKEWEPLLDWIPYKDLNLMGVESIALDPADPDRLYMACGTYTNPSTPDGAILWSGDRGKTFNRTDVPFKMGGNENGRGNGERMAVDPLNGNILYLGTRHKRLWLSTDRALSWSRVESFPDIQEALPEGTGERNSWRRRQEMGSGVIFVLFDPAAGGNGKSNVIYAGVSLMGRENLFRSVDGGESWHAVPGQPSRFRPTHGVLASNGVMYLTYGTNPGPWPMRNGAVWRLDTGTDTWKEITPDRPDPENGRAFGYAAVSVDASDPDVLIASTYHRYSAGGEELFRSTDGGETWTPLFQGGAEFDYSKAPYVKHTGVHWMFDVEIDPFDPDHALFTTGYGGHETFNLTDADRGLPTTWHIMSTGIEETVPLELLSPPEGGQVLSAIGDYCGFVHHDLDRPAPDCYLNPRFGNTDGIACAWQNPEVIVRVGIESADRPDENIAYSLDGGRSWQPAPSMPFPEARHGHIAVSADGAAWVWTPQRSRPYMTSDRGATWKEMANLPENTRVIADRADPGVFYAMDLFGGALYLSEDGSNTFETVPLKLPGGIPQERSGRGDNRGGQDRLYATPGMKGDIWLAAFHGLFHSENSGRDFKQLPGVEEIHAFGFGKAAPAADVPALYLVGTVDGVRGIFLSDDFGNSWVRINDDAHQWGLLLHVTGDPKKYGRVYVGTHGRGLIYGDPRQ